MTWLPWRQAWQDALYDGSGFYRAEPGPAAHFTTSTQGAPGVGELFAEGLVALARHASLTSFVDVGAGRGELLEQVHRIAPDLSCLGVDVRARPPLPEPVDWLTSPGGPELPDRLAGLTNALVVANEWLDVVPCAVAELDGELVPRTVLVEPGTGAERLGEPLSGAELDWCQGKPSHWPTGDGRPGDRVEVGLSRDLAWSDLVSRIDQGVAVAIDYGHLRTSRPAGGSLIGFRHGRSCEPLPDGTCDVTAHVAVDSLLHTELLTQREALRRLGITGSLPDHELATSDPAAYLAGLTRSGAATALLAPEGLGGFWWVVVNRGADGIP
jgi:SAM-dependent MidA family methyltransferase